MDQDLRDLLSVWWGGEAEMSRVDQLLSKLRTDTVFRREFIAEIQMMGMLRAVQSSEPRWLKIEDNFGWSAAAKSDFGPLEEQLEFPTAIPPRPARSRRLWRVRAVAAALLILLLALSLRPGGRAELPPIPVASRPQPEVTAEEMLGVVVLLDGVEWVTPAGLHPQEGSPLPRGRLGIRSGRVLLSLFTGVELSIEGPAEVELVSCDQVLCHHGKLRARVPAGSEGFMVSGPGSLVVDLGTEFGLNVESEGKSRGKVFKGEVEAAVVDTEGNRLRSQLIGESESFEIDPFAGRIMARGGPDPFAESLHAEPPPLVLDANYAIAISQSRPRGYWRFEDMTGGTFPNQVPGGPSLVSSGPVHLTTGEPQFNHSVVFDAGCPDQYLSLEELWEPARMPGFAVEFWFATSVINRAALFSLVAPEDTDHHLVLLETTFRQRPNGGFPVGKVRYLHRWPTGTHGGENLFSETYYVPYRWHHVVAQINQDRMELFINGTKMPLISLDSGHATAPCQVILGRLKATTTRGRPFVGRMDEVAIYDHPLAVEEIQKHYHLANQGVRPTPTVSPAR